MATNLGLNGSGGGQLTAISRDIEDAVTLLLENLLVALENRAEVFDELLAAKAKHSRRAMVSSDTT